VDNEFIPAGRETLGNSASLVKYKLTKEFKLVGIVTDVRAAQERKSRRLRLFKVAGSE
jgi:hypothetical protein